MNQGEIKQSREILIAVAILFNTQKEVLIVRKRGSAYYQLPGGKIQSSEQPMVAVLRELEEELGLSLDAGSLRLLGLENAEAIHEIGAQVKGYVFRCVEALESKDVRAQAEIEEVRWLSQNEWEDVQLANLLRKVVPAQWGDV